MPKRKAKKYPCKSFMKRNLVLRRGGGGEKGGRGLRESLSIKDIHQVMSISMRRSFKKIQNFHIFRPFSLVHPISFPDESEYTRKTIKISEHLLFHKTHSIPVKPLLMSLIYREGSNNPIIFPFFISLFFLSSRTPLGLVIPALSLF